MKLRIFIGILVTIFTVQLVTAQDDHDHDHDHDDLDWWENGVFYQIYPKSFKDNQYSSDGIGDIRGIIEKLPHLKDLGVTGTWLSPIFRSPMKDGGYDIADYKNVDPMFGTNADLKELFVKAKEHGLKIILDFVPNHTSDEHDWFKLSVNRTPGYEDYYVWRDCPFVEGVRQLPNNWISVFANPAWTYHPDRDQCYLHQFTPEQPDLNYENDEVRQAMIDILKHWLEEGADGFRIDAINHMYETEGLPNEVYIDPNGDVNSYDNLYHNHTMNLPKSYEFIYDVRKMMDEFVAEKNDNITRFMMTEAYATVPEQVLWYGASSSRLGSHMPFNFQLISVLDKNSNASEFKRAIDEWMDVMPDFGVPNWVMGNHDRSRVGSRYGEERQDSLAIMTMSLPGINVIYNGEEIGMVDYRNITWEETQDPWACNSNLSVFREISRDPVRTPFQWDDTDFAGFSSEKTWLPVHDNYKELNLKAQMNATKSTFHLYKHLIGLRKNHVLMYGDFSSKAIGTNVFAFTRTLANHKSIAVYINLGDEVTTKLSDLMDADDIPENAAAKVLAVNNNSQMNVDENVDVENIVLGKYDAVILEVSSASKVVMSALLMITVLIKFIF